MCDSLISTPGARSRYLDVYSSWRIHASIYMYTWTVFGILHGIIWMSSWMWLLFPRFNTYSADYPEKSVTSILKQEHIWYVFRRMIMTCLSQWALKFPHTYPTVPCPRCLLFKPKMTRLGSYRQIEILAFGRDVIGKLLSCVILILAFEGLLRLQMCPDHPENVT